MLSKLTRFFLAIVTDRVRSMTGRLCFDTCLSGCLSTPRGRVPRPGPDGGILQPGLTRGYPSQVQVRGGYPSQVQPGGYPTLGTPCQTWPGGIPAEGVPHLRYPPLDLAGEFPHLGYPPLDLAGGTPARGVPHLG